MEDDDSSDWTEHVDSATGSTFYYNHKTQVTQWDKPLCLSTNVDASQPNSQVADGNEGGNIAEDDSSNPAIVEDPSDWTEHVDPGTGGTFYYNHKTQVTQWEKPASWQQEITSRSLPQQYNSNAEKSASSNSDEATGVAAANSTARHAKSTRASFLRTSSTAAATAAAASSSRDLRDSGTSYSGNTNSQLGPAGATPAVTQRKSTLGPLSEKTVENLSSRKPSLLTSVTQATQEVKRQSLLETSKPLVSNNRPFSDGATRRSVTSSEPTDAKSSQKELSRSVTTSPRDAGKFQKDVRNALTTDDDDFLVSPAASFSPTKGGIASSSLPARLSSTVTSVTAAVTAAAGAAPSDSTSSHAFANAASRVPFSSSQGSIGALSQSEKSETTMAMSAASVPPIDRSLLNITDNSKFLEELSRRIGGASLERFAEVHFNLKGFAGSTQAKMVIEKLLTWKPELLKSPLLTLDGDLFDEALDAFRYISGFTGDRKTKKTPGEHGATLLEQMLDAPSALCDEVLCQLCKQSRANPSYESTERSWQLIILCLATFSPSDALLPALLGYFITVVASSSPSIAGLARVAINACIKSIDMPTRTSLPASMEIEALRHGRPSIVRVLFVDDSYLMFSYDSWTNGQQLAENISEKLGIPQEFRRCFQLFCATTSSDTADSNGYDSSNYPANREHVCTERPIGPAERIVDILTINQQRSSGHRSPSRIFLVFKIRHHAYNIPTLCQRYASQNTSGSNEIASYLEPDNGLAAMLDAIYIQAKDDILNQRYPITPNEYFLLATFQLQATFGDFPLSTVHQYAQELEVSASSLASEGFEDEVGLQSNADVLLKEADLKGAFLQKVMEACLHGRQLSEFLPAELCIEDENPSYSPRRHSSDVAASPTSPKRQTQQFPLHSRVWALYEKLLGFSQADARRAYLEYAASWPLYGSNYFIAEAQSNRDFPYEVVVAVNRRGVIIVDPQTRKFVVEYPYSQVLSWGHSYQSFVLITCSLQETLSKIKAPTIGRFEANRESNEDSLEQTTANQDKHYFKTEDGKEINDMLEVYMQQYDREKEKEKEELM